MNKYSVVFVLSVAFLGLVLAQETSPADDLSTPAPGTPPQATPDLPGTAAEGKEGEKKEGEHEDKPDEHDDGVVLAHIESDPGEKLDALPEVKSFLKEDLPYFRGVEYVEKAGVGPELVLLDKDNKELERIALAASNRTQIIDLLEDKGFRTVDPYDEEGEEDEDDDYYYRDEL